MKLQSGALYTVLYTNWHRDYNPLIFVLYSDSKYTIGMNVHYIRRDEYDKLVKMFLRVHKDPKLKKQFFENPREFYYDYLKPHFKDFIDVSFRRYFTRFVIGIPAHPVLLYQIGKDWRKRYYQKINNDKKNYNRYEFLKYRLKKDDRFKALKSKFSVTSPLLNKLKALKKTIMGAIGK